MLQNILGTHLELPVRLAIATVVIVALLGLTAFIVRHLSGQARVPGARSRQGRLAVMDTVAVDQKRSLVLVRRDDVEHLLLIGGSRDLVVEPGITREPGLLREAPAEREALGARETPLLRRTATTAPLAAPAPALAAVPEASAPAVPAPAAESAEPDSPASRFAALRRPRPDVDFASRLQHPASEDKDGEAELGATQEPPLAPRRLFETRIKRPRIGQTTPQASEPKTAPVKLAPAIVPPAAGESLRDDAAVDKQAPDEITPADVTPSDVEVHEPAAEVKVAEAKSIAVEIAQGQVAEASEAGSKAPSRDTSSGREPEAVVEAGPAQNPPQTSPLLAPAVEHVAPQATEPVLSQPAAPAEPDVSPPAARKPEVPAAPAAPAALSQALEQAKPAAAAPVQPEPQPRVGEPFITATPWPQEPAAAEPTVPSFPTPQAPIPQISEDDMAQRPAAARRPPVFNFARQPRDAQPAGRDLNLGDLAERLRGSLEKSLKPEPAEPRLDSPSHEPAARETPAESDHKPQPAPVAPAGAIRPSGLFRSTPIPEPVIKGDIHPVHKAAGTESTADVHAEESHPVRVVEPEKPLTVTKLDFESDFMRELELTLAGEAEALRAEPVPPRQDDTPPAAVETKVDSTVEAPPAAPAPVPKAANEPDPFEDLEAEMASLLGRMPTTKSQG